MFVFKMIYFNNSLYKSNHFHLPALQLLVSERKKTYSNFILKANIEIADLINFQLDFKY